ncbi:Uncharacterized protein DAT39_023005, partial [Clarias magur]
FSIREFEHHPLQLTWLRTCQRFPVKLVLQNSNNKERKEEQLGQTLPHHKSPTFRGSVRGGKG